MSSHHLENSEMSKYFSYLDVCFILDNLIREKKRGIFLLKN